LDPSPREDPMKLFSRTRTTSPFAAAPVATGLLTMVAAPLTLAAMSLPASAAEVDEQIEVIADAPSESRPSKPNMALSVPEFSLDSRVYDFPTGLRVIMQSDRSHDYVSVFMVVDHGAGDDPPGKNGTAHFVEHTWFRSVHGDLPPIMSFIQDLGVDFNATTRPDTTDYRTVANSEYLPILLRLESLRLTEPYVGMTEEQVETEREVVRNEWRRRNEQSQSLVFDYALRSTFPEGHPYHARETNESLDAIDLETLQAYFDEHYTPENTTLIVIGDFDIAEAQSLLFTNFNLELFHPDLTEEHLFYHKKPDIENPDKDNPDHWLRGAWDPANPGVDPFPFAPPRGPRVSRKTAPLPPPPDNAEIPTYKAAVDHQIVAVTWATPGGFRGDDFNMRVLAGTASSAIFSNLYGMNYLDTEERKRGLKDPGCFYQPMELHSMMMCAVEVTDTKRWDDPEQVAELLVDQLAEVWNPELVQLNQKFFTRGKMENLAYLLRSVDNVALHFGGRAEDIGFHAHFTGSVQYHSDAMNQVMASDFGRIANLGYEYMTRERAAITVINPIPESEIDKTAETSSYEGASEADTVIGDDDRTENVTSEQIAASYIEPNLDELIDRKLPNGMRIVVVPHGESPLVEATLVHGGGRDTDPPGQYTFASIFSDDDWAFAGGPGNDPLQIAAERTGGAYAFANGSGVRAPAGNLAGALWFLREEVETKRPDLNGRSSYLRLRELRMKRGWHRSAWHINDLFNRHLYPDAPHYWPTRWEDFERMSDWKGRDVKDWLGRHIQPANTTLLIVGNVDPDEAVQQAVEYFAGWEPNEEYPNEPVEPLPTPPMGQDSAVLVFDDPKRTQTTVRMACRLNFDGVEDTQAMSVLSNYVRDKTFSQLRVKEGLAYSPGGFAYDSPDGTGVLAFSSLAVNTGVGRTMEFFRDLTRSIEEGEVEDNDLTLYKLRLARNEGIKAQSTSQLTRKLLTPLRWDQPWSYLTDAGQVIADVDAERIQELADGCLGRSIATLQGPVDVITPQLDEKGIEYEVVDWKERGNALHEAADPRDYKKYLKKKAKAEAKKEEEKSASGDDDGSADGP
jgi:zinc protease